MDAPVSLGIPRAFATLPDPRKANHMHRFIDILTIALLAVIERGPLVTKGASK